MNQFIKKFGFLISVIAINLLVLTLLPQAGRRSLLFSGKIFKNFLFMLTPVFICIGLMDVWVEKEAMLKITGAKSGIRGILISFLLGMVTAVPLYALLPMAGLLLKKGGKLSNVLIFIGSCASIRIPLLLFEVSSLGWRFTLTRFIANVFIVIMIAFIIDVTLTQEDQKALYDNANIF
jgi:uncharacterized membrane protein YraQ (UPF0718 family)